MLSLSLQLQERVATHEKERRAIQTIMEQKIKALTDAIATVAVMDLTSPSTGPRNLQRLVHEVQALQRLVNASIAALRYVNALCLCVHVWVAMGSHFSFFCGSLCPCVHASGTRKRKSSALQLLPQLVV